jgi:polyhydroxyalkanoate synthesis regulator phasin
MAFKLPNFNIFNRLDARARVFVLAGVVVGIIALMYVMTKFLAGGRETTGASRVATAPQGLQSVPGGQLTQEYYRALQQANTQAAQQAQISGSSAVPTLVNIGGNNAQCIVCTEETPNVKALMDDMVRQGKITPEVANYLQQLANKDVHPDDYAAALDQLVKDGKIPPEQARQLLDNYKRQHALGLLQKSAKGMDNMIKSGQLSIESANQLLQAQKDNISPAAYGDKLQSLVKQGKLAPRDAQRLLSQYTQQRTQDVIQQSIAALKQMARNGEITAEVEKTLTDLENQFGPVDGYAAQLQKFIDAGKLTPVASKKILDEYKSQKAAIGAGQVIQQLITKAAGNEQKAQGLRDLAEKLADLQGNNASPAAYADALKQGVNAGLLTPDEAAQMMQEYQNLTALPPPAAVPVTGGGKFAELQQKVQQNAPTTPVAAPTASEFAAAQTQVQTANMQDKRAQIQEMLNAMSAQAGQLVNAWQPPVMIHREGQPPATPGTGEAGGGAGGGAGAGGETPGSTKPTGAPLIKAGAILFAVLDTAVNSDYPDSPVMATVVDGKFKGAKLLGKLVTTKGISGQMDRVSLNFTLMNTDEWLDSKTVTAYAIDPDTARTVLASSVDYHYMQRFGAIMATSFLEGYGNAVLTSGSTTTTSVFGTSTAHPELSPGNKIAAGLGQIGQTLGDATKPYINRPPTVRVDSGVGLGILFMSDVSM